MTPAVHLLALSSLLARDPEAGKLHHRHLQVLAQLCLSRKPLTATQIAAALDVRQPQMSRLLLKLENHGMISRTDPRHRPMVFCPTASGRALDARVRGHVKACLRAEPDRTAA
jgi:DNA-binding MarR family transcriptional regulator